MRGETWYAFCRRCGVRLVRIGPGSWRPLSEEELASEHATLFAANGTAAPAAPLETPPQKKVAKAKTAKISASKKNSEKAKAGSVRSNAVSAPGQGYEASYLARKHGISTNEARALIKRVGNDRDKLNAAAERLVEKRIRNAQPRAGKER